MEEERTLSSPVPRTAKQRAREAGRDALRGQSDRASAHVTLHRSAGSRAEAEISPRPATPAHFTPFYHCSRCQALSAILVPVTSGHWGYTGTNLSLPHREVGGRGRAGGTEPMVEVLTKGRAWAGPGSQKKGKGAEPRTASRPRLPLPSPACGSLTRTLDSGIGTFPPPDHGSSGTPSKNLPKTKPPRLEPPPGVPPARPPPLTKVPRRAHTLEREVPGIEELLVSGRHPSMPAFPALLTAAPGHRGHQTCPDGECLGRWGGGPLRELHPPPTFPLSLDRSL